MVDLLDQEVNKPAIAQSRKRSVGSLDELAVRKLAILLSWYLPSEAHIDMLTNR